jgi:hypothetical protein
MMSWSVRSGGVRCTCWECDVRVGNVVWVVVAVGEGMVVVVGAIGITGLVPVRLSTIIGLAQIVACR